MTQGRRWLKAAGIVAVVGSLWFSPPGSTSGMAQPGQAGPEASQAIQELSLEEAYRLAMENSRQIREALLELQDAELNLQHVRSTGLMRPDPVALLQAESAADIAQRNLSLAQDAVRLQVAEDYLGVVRLENLMAVAQEGYALAQRQLAIAEDRYEVGAVARIDVIRAANQVSLTEANLMELEGNRELALMALRMTLGLDLQAPVYPVNEPLDPGSFETDLEADLAFALENRVEILRARTGVETARKQVELSDNDYTPALVLARAQVGLERAKQGLDQAQDGIELEVRQIHQSLLDAQRRLAVLQRRIDEAREELRITEEMYDAGVSTSVEVLGSQTQLTEAQTDYVNTLFDYQIAQVRYAHATARSVAASESGDERWESED